MAYRHRTAEGRRRWPSQAALATCLLALALLVGCSSAGPETAQTATATTSSDPSPRQAAEIRSLDLSEDDGLASLELVADRPLVWTSFRNPEGDLVVELPNSAPAPSLADLEPSAGLVAAVEVETVDDSERPLTRLTVRTREPSEHSLVGDGDRLQLTLLPIDSAQDVTLAYEPLEEEEPPALAVAPAPAEETQVAEQAASDAPQTGIPPAGIPQTYGTADEPQIGPAPSGVVATQLFDVDVLDTRGATIVQVAGDGEFAYSTFRLQNPDRFVVDLEGVVNTAASSTVPVASAEVEQIRIGQFKPAPEPVSRVVFDLRESTIPRVERGPDGLIVRFGEGSAAPLEMAQAPSMDEPPTAAEILTDDSANVEVAELAEPAPIFEEPVAEPMAAEPAMDDPMAADLEPADDVSNQYAAPAAPAPTPVYEPSGFEPAPPLSEPARMSGTGADVALFEAQQVDVADPDVRRERLLESFGELVVNREEREYVGEPISMSLRNADLVETLRSFAKISDLNFVIQPGVRGSVTVELTSVPWDQAMEQILKINNLGMDIDGTIVRIAPRQQLAQEAEEQARLRQARAQTVPLRTLIRSLSYARANEVASLLSSSDGAILSRRGTVQVDVRTNTLIIRELPDVIDTVLAVIDTLDTPEPQVSIEARIIEATKNFSRTLGISWDYDYIASPENGNTTGLVFPNTVDSDGGVNVLTGGANGFLNVTLGNILDTFNLNARIQAAEAEGLINVVSAPRITTLNNNSASIQSGLQIPIQTVSDRTVSVQFVNATLNLTVTPQVTAEGTVLLDINVAKRTPQLAFAVVGATNAPIATKEARTRVIVRDGGTAVIGGIYEVSSNQNQDRVPGLANIPILGYLFKNRNRSSSNDELMIFITPRIVQI
ncbi:MAG: type IV pilus secretin PilQ [Acidobacteriota bacterium]